VLGFFRTIGHSPSMKIDMELLRRLNPNFVYQLKPHEFGGGFVISFMDSVDGDCVTGVINEDEVVRLITDLGLVIGKEVKLQDI